MLQLMVEGSLGEGQILEQQMAKEIGLGILRLKFPCFPAGYNDRLMFVAQAVYPKIKAELLRHGIQSECTAPRDDCACM